MEFAPTPTTNISTVSVCISKLLTLSDTSDGDCRSVNKDIMVGQRPFDRRSPLVWPRQPTVTKSQVKLWARYLRTRFVTTEALHLRRPLGKWRRDSNLGWRYTQTQTDILLDTTLHLQATPIRSPRRSTTFSVWRPASRITTFSTRLLSPSSTHSLQCPVARWSRLRHHFLLLSRSRLTCCSTPLAPGGCSSILTNMSPTHV